jgi:hypothetical protein
MSLRERAEYQQRRAHMAGDMERRLYLLAEEIRMLGHTVSVVADNSDQGRLSWTIRISMSFPQREEG